MAFIQPYARGARIPFGTSEADVLEALLDFSHKISIDSRRIYAAGDCEGGRGAIILTEDHPDIFKAVATINAATGFELNERSRAEDKANPLLRIRRLSTHPIGLVHEDPDYHSPFSQAILFNSEAARVGLTPTVIRLPADNTYTLRYTREELFHFLGTLP